MSDAISDDMVTICLQGTEDAVRATLLHWRNLMAAHGLDEDFQGTAEIVLAEVLNNVVEHANAGLDEDAITVEVRFLPDYADVQVTDKGIAMPEGKPPNGIMPDVGGPTETLPEGGFGWALVRRCCTKIHYQWIDDRNRLKLHLPYKLPD